MVASLQEIIRLFDRVRGEIERIELSDNPVFESEAPIKGACLLGVKGLRDVVKKLQERLAVTGMSSDKKKELTEQLSELLHEIDRNQLVFGRHGSAGVVSQVELTHSFKEKTGSLLAAFIQETR